MSESICRCGEAGYYHCSELKAYVKDLRRVIKIIIESDALKCFAYERGDDDASIRELCDHVLKWPDEKAENDSEMFSIATFADQFDPTLHQRMRSSSQEDSNNSSFDEKKP